MTSKGLPSAAAFFLALACSTAIAGIASEPGKFAVTEGRIAEAGRDLHVTLVKPIEPRHPNFCVVFATGDGGWRGASSEVFEHLAEQSYAVAGLSSPDVIKPLKHSGERITGAVAADRLGTAFAQIKRDLGFSDNTPVVVVGFSRGATMVAFAAVHPELRDGIAGAVAIALTREADFLRATDDEERRPEVEVDDKGRIQIYPALKLLGTARIAVIQSTNDSYVPAAEARELLGPDTATQRLYIVEAKNHGFGGGRDVLLRDLDDALAWIEASAVTAAAKHY